MKMVMVGNAGDTKLSRRECVPLRLPRVNFSSAVSERPQYNLIEEAPMHAMKMNGRKKRAGVLSVVLGWALIFLTP